MAEPLLITGCAVAAEGELLPRGDLLLQGGKIRKIGRRIHARGIRTLHGRGLMAAPGLIDTQINGGFGRSFGAATPEEVLEVGRKLLSVGVTSYLPTLMCLPPDRTRKAIATLVAASTLAGGARLLGLHLEGPFLAPARNGAHLLRNLRPPSLAEFRALHRASAGLLRIMTIAPELPGAAAVIRDGARRGVIMSAGHSEASAAEVARAALDGGLRHVTHVFNAMAPLHHRHETILNAALAIDRLSCSFIYDRDHVGVGSAVLLLKAKPPLQAVLVSDAVAALGMADGELKNDGETYVIKGGRVTVKKNGRLAGSATSLLEGVRRIAEDLAIPPHAALDLATRAPARLLGLEGRLGVLKPGAAADLVLFGKELDVRMAFVGGELRHGNHH